MKQRIRLTEDDLHRIVNESVKRVLKESNFLRYIPGTSAYKSHQRTKALRKKWGEENRKYDERMERLKRQGNQERADAAKARAERLRQQELSQADAAEKADREHWARNKKEYNRLSQPMGYRDPITDYMGSNPLNR